MADKNSRKVHSFVSYAFWTLLLQALVFIALGILVILYPVVLVALVAANFIWMGITTFLLAWRVRQLKGDIPELLMSHA